MNCRCGTSCLTASIQRQLLTLILLSCEFGRLSLEEHNVSIKCLCEPFHLMPFEGIEQLWVSQVFWVLRCVWHQTCKRNQLVTSSQISHFANLKEMILFHFLETIQPWIVIICRELAESSTILEQYETPNIWLPVIANEWFYNLYVLFTISLNISPVLYSNYKQYVDQVGGQYTVDTFILFVNKFFR